MLAKMAKYLGDGRERRSNENWRRWRRRRNNIMASSGQHDAYETGVKRRQQAKMAAAMKA